MYQNVALYFDYISCDSYSNILYFTLIMVMNSIFTQTAFQVFAPEYTAVESILFGKIVLHSMFAFL